MESPRQSLRMIFPDLPGIVALDVGASDLDGEPPYSIWLDDPAFSLFGFEPSRGEYERLKAINRGRAKVSYLPHALGDGNRAELKICRAPGMTSLLEPDLAVLEKFHGFAEWSQVLERVPIDTRRLDDLAEIDSADYIKLDIQGSELRVLENGTRILETACCVHLEVNFVPFYREQPLFAELDQFLRSRGFLFHRFTSIISRSFPPLIVNRDIYQGISQQLWSDAIYFRPFSEFDQLPVECLLKTGLIAHDLYGSVDLAHLALEAFDRKTGERSAVIYRQFLGIGN